MCLIIYVIFLVVTINVVCVMHIYITNTDDDGNNRCIERQITMVIYMFSITTTCIDSKNVSTQIHGNPTKPIILHYIILYTIIIIIRYYKLLFITERLTYQHKTRII